MHESEKLKGKLLSRVQLLVTPWTAAYQAPPSMGFSRQEYWSGVPLPSRLGGLGHVLVTGWEKYIWKVVCLRQRTGHLTYPEGWPADYTELCGLLGSCGDQKAVTAIHSGWNTRGDCGTFLNYRNPETGFLVNMSAAGLCIIGKNQWQAQSHCREPQVSEQLSQ